MPPPSVCRASFASRSERDSGRTVTDTDRLRVATTDFLVAGGDGFFTPVSPLRDVKDEGRLVRDGIAGWIQRHGGTWRAADLLTDREQTVDLPWRAPRAVRHQ